MITIGRGSKYYRPYVTYVNGVERYVRQIHIYDENEIILSINQGWLEKKDGDITVLEIEGVDELKLKRKIKFDGSVFIVSTPEKKCDLYIPNSLLKFKRADRYLNKYLWHIIDVWKSEVVGAVHEVHRTELKLNNRLYELEKEFRAIVGDRDFKIYGENIVEQLDKLKELREEYLKEVERLENIDVNKVVEEYEKNKVE